MQAFSIRDLGEQRTWVKHLFRYRVVLLSILIVIPTQAYSSSDLEIQIERDNSTTHPADSLFLRFHLHNRSEQPLSVLKWDIPFGNQLNGNLFNVRQDGTLIEYIGPLSKRAEPGIQDYITLEAGETISRLIDLSHHYAIRQTGQYEVSFKQNVNITEQVIDTLQKYTLKLQSKKISLPLLANKTIVSRKQAPAFSSCDIVKRLKLDNALTKAERLALEASQILESTPLDKRPIAVRYNTWFGPYSEVRYSALSNQFNQIHNALSNQQVTFDCTCNDVDDSDQVYAYVFPNEPYRIHLCEIFFNAADSGTDSKGGIILHEMTHFNDVIGTDDHAYGHNNCQALAQTDPELALDNADSHEYFAENTPALPMDSDNDNGGNSGGGGGSGNNFILRVNRPIAASVAANGWTYFKVRGASRVKLYHLSSDLDLFVRAKRPPSQFDFDCSPFHLNTRNEACNVSINDTVYIGVHGGDQGGSFRIVAKRDEPPAITPQRGLWWNPDQIGTGFDIEINGNQLAVLWYTYHVDGSPVWYLANGSYSGIQGNATVQTYRWDGSKATPQDVGTLNLDFTDPNHGNLAWSINGQSGQQTIEFFKLTNQAGNREHSGIWYQADKPGYGVTVVQQGDALAKVLYFYDAAGLPRWVLSKPGSEYEMETYTGACPYCDDRAITHHDAGTLNLGFSSASQGTLSSAIQLPAPLTGSWNISSAIIRNLSKP